MEGPNTGIEEKLTEEEVEILERDSLPVFKSLKETFNKWGRVMAFAALMAGATTEASAKDAKLPGKKVETSETVEVRKAIPVPEVRKAIPVNKESVEYKKRQQVNDICHKNGFKIVDAHTGNMEVFLPPKEVKKVIVFLGQLHAEGSYEQADPVFVKQVNDSQETIFRMFEDAHMLTGKVTPCIQEGVMTQEQADSSVPSAEDMGNLIELLKKASKTNTSAETFFKVNTQSLSKYATASFEKEEAVNFVNASLYDMTLANRFLLEGSTLAVKQREKLQQFDTKVKANIDYNRLVYTLGGSSLAARHGHVKMYPGESYEANVNVAKNIYRELGIQPDINLSFYDVISKLSPQDQKRARDLLAVYAHSKERELPALTGAEQQLKDKEVVVVVYGNAHTFDETLKGEYSSGNMQNTAMVKIDSRFVSFAATASR